MSVWFTQAGMPDCHKKGGWLSHHPVKLATAPSLEVREGGRFVCPLTQAPFPHSSRPEHLHPHYPPCHSLAEILYYYYYCSPVSVHPTIQKPTHSSLHQQKCVTRSCARCCLSNTLQCEPGQVTYHAFNPTFPIQSLDCVM